MRKRRPASKPEMIGDILQKVLKKRNIPHKAVDRRLVDLWRRTVGPQIAARTLPDTVKRGVLYVLVSSPVWLHQLQFMKEEILRKMNELSGSEKIRGLFLSIGEIPPSPAEAAAHPTPAQATPSLAKCDRDVMRESLDTIRDPELKGILERAMTSEISRRRRLEKRRDP